MRYLHTMGARQGLGSLDFLMADAWRRDDTRSNQRGDANHRRDSRRALSASQC